ncbi:MAG TPA: CpaF family protein, partial [Syntrophothermus lipocalidus]|nr:CpaF family protein [Syntrophothermus lipocalidus]
MSLLKRLEAEKSETRKLDNRQEKTRDPHQDLVQLIHREVIKEIDSEFLKSRSNGGETDDEQIRQEVKRIAEAVLDREGGVLLRVERERIMAQVLDEILGFGPITPLLEDEDVSEIMVNGP